MSACAVSEVLPNFVALKMLKNSGLVHEAPAIRESRKGQMYAAISLHMERLFPCFEPMTFQSQWSNGAVTPWLTLIPSQ